MEEKDITRAEIQNKIKTVENYVTSNFLTTKNLRDTASKQYVETNHLDWEFNVADWSEEDLLKTIDNILNGMSYFHSDYSEGKSFPIGNFNNVKKVFKGNDNILYINKKSIYRFSPEVRRILNNYGRLHNNEITDYENEI